MLLKERKVCRIKIIKKQNKPVTQEILEMIKGRDGEEVNRCLFLVIEGSDLVTLTTEMYIQFFDQLIVISPFLINIIITIKQYIH